MRHPALLAISAISTALFGGVPARSAETTGWIASVDHDIDAITLHDGRRFLLPEDIGGAMLTEGTRVRITFTPGTTEMTVLCVAFEPSRRGPPDGSAGKSEPGICSAMPAPPPSPHDGRPIRLERWNFRFPQR